MKFKDFIKTWSWQILAITFFVLSLLKGCTSTKISKTNTLVENNNAILTAKVDSLTGVIINLQSTTLTHKQVTDIMERVMLDFLIYEDDLDKGKTSLSQVKNKIEAND